MDKPHIMNLFLYFRQIVGGSIALFGLWIAGGLWDHD